MKSEYESLYNKYRPKTFKDLVGQEHVSITLTKAFQKNRLSQAYLLCGGRGSGKTTTARILAMGYNCENGPTADPCGTCQSCKDILDERCIDIVEVDVATKTGVNDIRDLQMSATTVPSQVKTKFYIMDEVHQMTAAAQNSFLKTLEEPPPNVVFVLCTTEASKLKDTIVSRTQVFEFKRISVAKICERLEYIIKEEKFTADNDALVAVARTCEGGMRDAIVKLSTAMCVTDNGHISLDIVNSVIGTTGLEQCYDLSKAIISNDPCAVFQVIGKVTENTINLQPFYLSIVSYFRDLLAIACNPSIVKSLDLTENREKEILKQSKSVSVHSLLECLKQMLGYGRMMDTVKGRMVIETMCIESMCTINKKATVTPEAPATAPVKAKAITWADIRGGVTSQLIQGVLDSAKPTYDDSGLTISTAGLSTAEQGFINKALPQITEAMQKAGCKNISISLKNDAKYATTTEIFGG